MIKMDRALLPDKPKQAFDPTASGKQAKQNPEQTKAMTTNSFDLDKVQAIKLK
jgi:hypothetical protein